MKLVLMRHGEAEPIGMRADCDRQLTERGRQLVSVAVRQKASQLRDIDLILHSPYLRAKQTAQIAASIINAPLHESSLWIPSAAINEAVESLEPYAEARLLVVTHLPLVGEVASLLLSGYGAQPEPFHCAHMICMNMPWPAQGLGQMNWQT